MPWSPIGPESKILSPARTERGSICHSWKRAADARRRDIHAICFAMLHNFRVAAHNSHAGFAQRLRHGPNFGLENLRGQPRFEDKSHHHCFRPAPDTARSFTVPLTANSPIEPPGKLSGLTTKLSVVIAILRR